LLGSFAAALVLNPAQIPFEFPDEASSRLGDIRPRIRAPISPLHPLWPIEAGVIESPLRRQILGLKLNLNHLLPNRSNFPLLSRCSWRSAHKAVVSLRTDDYSAGAGIADSNKLEFRAAPGCCRREGLTRPSLFDLLRSPAAAAAVPPRERFERKF